MGVKSRGLLSLRTNLFIFFTDGGREHQTAQLLRHAVSNHVIRTPLRDDRTQARRAQASGRLSVSVLQSLSSPKKLLESFQSLVFRWLRGISFYPNP